MDEEERQQVMDSLYAVQRHLGYVYRMFIERDLGLAKDASHAFADICGIVYAVDAGEYDAPKVL
jgi:hypothetical protein